MKRPWLWLGLVAVLIVLAALAGGPGASPDAGPGGTLALRRLLGRMGYQVQDADNPPAGRGVFLLLADLRSQTQDDALLGWARDGGTLVVADTGSVILSEQGITEPGIVGSYSGSANLAPGCAAPETVGVDRLTVDGSDSVLAAGDAGTVGCFPTGGRAGGDFELAEPIGRGRLVVLGGISPFTNQLLDKQSNATFALGLLGSAGTTVVFGSPAPPAAATQAGLWGSLPGTARAVLVEVVIALLVFAAYRARRFGKPVVEHLPAPVPAGELVDAVGRLYRSAGAAAFAGETLRAFTMRWLGARTGAGPGAGPGAVGGWPGADPEALSTALAELTGRRREDVHRVVAGPPASRDEDLITLGRELEELRAQVGGHQAPAPPRGD